MIGGRAPGIDQGEPAPLGASWDGKGVNFALFSAHAEKVELCLFDARGRRELHRLALPGYTDEVWHGYVADARPGTLYGYRVFGPYQPEHGHRFNHHKLLLDPYAKAIAGPLRWSDAHFGYRVGSQRGEASFDRHDDAAVMPKSVVVDPALGTNGAPEPKTAWSDTVIYELHVRGFTMTFPGVPPAIRGTFAALSAPPVIDYLLRLGVSAVELLPVQAFIDDRVLVERGLRNYWGYNTIGFFAPHPGYLGEGDIGEFRAMVERFHAAGLEVLLDVVYNHTAEGDHLGPTLSFRGIDNKSYYRLSEDPFFYENVTGCGNTLNVEHPRVLGLVIDSLRYWADTMRVDGFRFDLAPVLARTAHGFDPNAAFFAAIAQDPVLARVKLIAEPWDLGPGGYQLGRFPPGWSEWNDKFRDGARRFWQGAGGMIPELAARLGGSGDVFAPGGRNESSSINFVTAHDGFTLHDLVSYNYKQNEENGEANTDGSDANYSWNCGVEGPADEPHVLALRARQKRNLLATLLLAQGVPMLPAGDERGHTQYGNNNAYCQDNPLSWIDWLPPGDADLTAFVRGLITLRRDHPALRSQRNDVTWYSTDGREMSDDDWFDAGRRAIGYGFHGGSEGQRFLIYFNAHDHEVPLHVPHHDAGWEAVIDTAGDPRGNVDAPFHFERESLQAHSVVVLCSRTPA
jgi:isoamylase